MASKVKKGYKYTPTVFDGYFYDMSGDLVFKAKANTDASVTIETTKTEKRAGQGAPVLFTIYSDRTATATMTALDIQTQYITANLGTTARIGKSAFLRSLSLQAKEGAVTLPAVPTDGRIIADIGGNYITVPASAVNVDLSTYGVTNDCVNVTMLYEADGVTVPIPTNSSPMAGKLVLNTPIYMNGG